MKKLLFLACMVGLTGCGKAITDEAVAEVQINRTYNASGYYLEQYNQKGTNDKVYQNFKVNGEYFQVDDAIESVMFQCSNQLHIQKTDIEKIFNSIFSEDRYMIKDGVNIDYQLFNKCLDKQLAKVPLNYKNLMIFSNDPDVQKYKETDQAISDLITKAKADGEISYFEALNIYLAINTQREKDFFNKI